MLKVQENATAAYLPGTARPADSTGSTRAEAPGTSPTTTGWRRRYVTGMRAVDALAVALALMGTHLIRFQLENAGLDLGPLSVPYWIVGTALALVWWGFLELRGARDVRLIGYGLEETRQVVSATLVLFGALAIVSFAFAIPTARSYVLIALPLGLGLLIGGRFVLRDALAKERAIGESLSRTLLVGRLAGVTELHQSLRRHPMAGFDTAAVYAPTTKRQLPPELRRVELPPNALPAGESPSVDGIVATCRRHGIETVIVSQNVPLSTKEIRHLSWQLADARIRLVMETGLTDIAGPRIHMQQVAGLPLIHVATPKLSRGRALTKRAMDILLSSVALLVLSPVLLALAGIVRAHDKGPALFAQERVGQDGRRFRMLKFRSMRTDAEQVLKELRERNEGAGLLFKMKDDPRVTGPGKWMRRYSLDELPQFLNVLKGDMSLVGPRPPLPQEVEQYEDYVHRRMRVKPGITGLWQVSGRSNLDWEQSVRLDLYYVENWSPIEDMLILGRTVKAVIAKEGAY
ncbi:sugar transferase [Kocuria sp. LUK]|uniref:sugar transferase n=1 Tax=Kocuria sp. LUK TaxID=2897828 RepID=UPI001E2AC338|nr:sugar transferase [Kocuria sp. LUK]MCD1144960.1 sugar transferase [Kocuria sp. LUK]